VATIIQILLAVSPNDAAGAAGAASSANAASGAAMHNANNINEIHRFIFVPSFIVQLET
jgi:hypothetical protein